jgi:CRP/FNR family cyclic AMP-dependent transcriptional regulator
MPRVFDTTALVTFVTCKQTSRVYPPGSILFTEGDPPKGLHILNSGRVILKIAHAGELLGLNAVILGKPYLLGAEAIEPSRVSHVVRSDFLDFLRKSPEASRQVIQQLSSNYYTSQREIRTLNLSSSIREKFARLLVSWIEDSDGGTDDAIWINMDLTHEQMGQMLGASRETISRVIAALSRLGVIRIKGHMLEVPSVVRLRELAKL